MFYVQHYKFQVDLFLEVGLLSYQNSYYTAWKMPYQCIYLKVGLIIIYF